MGAAQVSCLMISCAIEFAAIDSNEQPAATIGLGCGDGGCCVHAASIVNAKKAKTHFIDFLLSYLSSLSCSSVPLKKSASQGLAMPATFAFSLRSEERRVGKECRS